MTKMSESAMKAAKVMTGLTSILFVFYIYGRLVSDVCPAYEPLDSFDVERFKGVWYELQRDESIRF